MKGYNHHHYYYDFFVFIAGKSQSSSNKSSRLIKTNFPAEQRSIQINQEQFPKMLIFEFFYQWLVVTFVSVTLLKNCSSSNISPINVTKSAVCCEFDHIYWKNPYWKLHFLCNVTCNYLRQYIINTTKKLRKRKRKKSKTNK